MAVVIQLRRDTASNWTSANPTLAIGEFAIETDTDKYKIGDGSTAWTSLDYSSLPSNVLPLTGGTLTGDLSFEGSTADGNETTITVVDPTADRTITLPDASGTVAFIASPTFTGTPAGPTAAANTSTTQLATTAFVMTELGDYAPIASPTFTGTVNADALDAPLAINAQTGTTYTFIAGDAGKLVTSSNGSAQTFTVPPNSSVAFDVGTQIMLQNIGSANCTLAQGSGVTIQSVDSNKEIDGQFAAATLIKTATDTWSLIGSLK